MSGRNWGYTYVNPKTNRRESVNPDLLFAGILHDLETVVDAASDHRAHMLLKRGASNDLAIVDVRVRVAGTETGWQFPVLLRLVYGTIEVDHYTGRYRFSNTYPPQRVPMVEKRGFNIIVAVTPTLQDVMAFGGVVEDSTTLKHKQVVQTAYRAVSDYLKKAQDSEGKITAESRKAMKKG